MEAQILKGKILVIMMQMKRQCKFEFCLIGCVLVPTLLLVYAMYLYVFYEQQFFLIIPIFQVVIDNGLLQLTLSNPGGLIRGIQYNGMDNLLELHNQDLNGGYLTSLFGQAFPVS